MNKKKRLLNLLPAFWTSIFDIIITTIFQPNEYWEGNLKVANEGNPIGNVFMQNHVYGLFLISAIWLIIIGLLGYYLPNKIAQIFLLFVLMAHTWGASTWLSTYFGFWSVIAFILFNSILYILIREAKPKSH